MNVKEQSGFTIVELMMALVIAGIVLGIGVPSLRSFVRNNEAVSNVNRLVNALALARSEAASRGVTVMVAPAADAESDWAKGWVIGQDVVVDGTFPGAGDSVFRAFEPIANATFTASPGSISFRAAGGVDAVAVFTIMPDDCIDDHNPPRTLSVGPAGFVDLTYGTCP
jgi:prepilin-type N-terminal cleavage/methylation domain-containing protein